MKERQTDIFMDMVKPGGMPFLGVEIDSGKLAANDCAIGFLKLPDEFSAEIICFIISFTGMSSTILYTYDQERACNHSAYISAQ